MRCRKEDKKKAATTTNAKADEPKKVKAAKPKKTKAAKSEKVKAAKTVTAKSAKPKKAEKKKGGKAQEKAVKAKKGAKKGRRVALAPIVVEKARLISSVTVYQGPLFRIQHDQLIEPDGLKSERDVIRHNGSVVILAMVASKSKKNPWIVIERQYRHAANQLPVGAAGERAGRSGRRGAGGGQA